MVYRKAVRAAALPWNQRRERRAAASTSELGIEFHGDVISSQLAFPLNGFVLPPTAGVCGSVRTMARRRTALGAEEGDG